MILGVHFKTDQQNFEMLTRLMLAFIKCLQKFSGTDVKGDFLLYGVGVKLKIEHVI